MGRDIEAKLSQYERTDDGKLEKVHDLNDLLGLKPKMPKTAPPPNFEAMAESPWTDVVFVPSSQKEDSEPS